MRRMQIVAAIYASALLASCSEPATVPAGPDVDAPVDSDFETAELQVGSVRMREVWVPRGYSLVDMNNRGDLLLGSAWLPKGRVQPLAMPFAGRSINNHRQVLGPGRMIFTAGRVSELPDPCIPFSITLTTTTSEGTTSEDFEFNCSQLPVEVNALADNGDALAAYREDAPGTALSPYRYFKVWRASQGEWQTVFEAGLTEVGRVEGVISDNGVFAWNLDWSYRTYTSTGQWLSGQGICPVAGPVFDPPTIPRGVNDAAEVVGLIYCQGFGVDGVGVRWSSTGVPTRLGGTPSAIDSYGNAAGVRDSDGHAVVWLTDGSMIDLSSGAGTQPASVRKFLKRGQIFGFVGTKPVVWRFGFPDQ